MLPTLTHHQPATGNRSETAVHPATLATSCAFMLPIATAPNAIVFGSGRLTSGQMARYGVFLNLIGVPCSRPLPTGSCVQSSESIDSENSPSANSALFATSPSVSSEANPNVSTLSVFKAAVSSNRLG